MCYDNDFDFAALMVFVLSSVLRSFKMDVRTRLILVLAVLMCGYATGQIAKPEPVNNVPREPTKQCVTAKNVSGLCVPRQGCDYGTPAIDMTLYATHNYRRPCAMEEVCCPTSAIVHFESHTNSSFIDSDEVEEFNR